MLYSDQGIIKYIKLSTGENPELNYFLLNIIMRGPKTFNLALIKT